MGPFENGDRRREENIPSGFLPPKASSFPGFPSMTWIWPPKQTFSERRSASALQRTLQLLRLYDQGRPFGDCLLLSALLHRASSAAGHAVEQ